MNARAEKVQALYNYLTVRGFAEAIHRSEDTVRRLIKRPDRQGFQIQGAYMDGAGYLIPPSEVERWKEYHKVVAKAVPVAA